MLAKILVGVVAAITVTGVGVYYAMPGSDQPSCCGKKDPAPTQSAPPSDAVAACPTDGELPTCCSKSLPATCPAPDATGLAAGVGGMVLTNTGAPKKSLTKAEFRCCDK